MGVNARLGSVFRRFVVLPTANVGLVLGSGAVFFTGLAEKPPQKRPSVLKTSIEGMYLEQNPINLQP